MQKTGAAAVVLAVFAGPVAAGQVVQARMTASAQMQVSDGALKGCGLRVVAIATDDLSAVTAVDFSFNTYRSGGALVKAGARMATTNASDQVLAPSIRPMDSFWVRTLGQEATKPDKAGILQSDSPKGYLLYGTTTASVASLFGAAFEGRPVQVGVRLAGESTERILSGTITESDTEINEVARCMTELTEAMSKDVEAAERKSK